MRLSYIANKKDFSESEKSFLVNLTTKQVETLIEVLEDIDSKLQALGVVEIGGTMIYDPSVS